MEVAQLLFCAGAKIGNIRIPLLPMPLVDEIDDYEFEKGRISLKPYEIYVSPNERNRIRGLLESEKCMVKYKLLFNIDHDLIEE